MCAQKRIADGGRNHKHPFELDPPAESDDTNSYEEAIELRKTCQRLGIRSGLCQCGNVPTCLRVSVCVYMYQACIRLCTHVFVTISPTTGLIKDISERCDIYRKRIAEHFEALQKVMIVMANHDDG
jgi:hypothetical protein